MIFRDDADARGILLAASEDQNVSYQHQDVLPSKPVIK